MITTLTPNPCFDRTLSVPEFSIYKMNRVKVLRTDVGGKGINVSAALRNMGIAVCTVGLQFSGSRVPQEKFMEENALNWIPVEVPGELRTCIKIFDETLRHTIEINETGCPVLPEAAERLIAETADAAKKSSAVVMAGSLPAGFEDDFYSRCIQAVRCANPGCRIAVDAEKKLLLRALEASPSFIKPNIHEFCDTFGCAADSLEELHREAQKIIKRFKLEFICVSKGSEGAYISNGREGYFCTNPPVDVRSIQGAGDSVVAGMCIALEKNLPLAEILKTGVACAAASISREGTLLCTPELVAEMLSRNMIITRIG